MTGGKCKPRHQSGGGFTNLAGSGPYNVEGAGCNNFHHFTKSEPCLDRKTIMNPPNLPKAGSGNGNAYPFA